MSTPLSDLAGGDIAAKLQAYLSGKGLDDPRISHLRRLTGGSSHDTWALDLTAGGGVNRPLVMRRNFAESSLDMGPEEEFRLLTWLAAQGLPVAKPWLCAVADSPFGVPFVLAERIGGTDLRKAVAAGLDTSALAPGLVALQARIHALALGNCPAVAHAGPVRHEVERWTGALLSFAEAKAGPLARMAVAWLRSNIPEPPRLCLVHGDFKANNILWSKNGAAVLLDWELAHIGDPIEDIAWTMLWLSKYDIVGGMLSPVDYVAAYEAASGIAVDRARLHFWQLFAFVKLSAILLSGSGSKQSGPSQVLLSCAVPCLEAGMAAFLQKLNPTENAA